MRHFGIPLFLFEQEANPALLFTDGTLYHLPEDDFRYALWRRLVLENMIAVRPILVKMDSASRVSDVMSSREEFVKEVGQDLFGEWWVSFKRHNVRCKSPGYFISKFNTDFSLIKSTLEASMEAENLVEVVIHPFINRVEAACLYQFLL